LKKVNENHRGLTKDVNWSIFKEPHSHSSSEQTVNVPIQMVQDKKITPDALWLYVYMASMQDFTRVTRNQLAGMTGYPIEDFREHLRTLYFSGWLVYREKPYSGEDGVVFELCLRGSLDNNVNPFPPDEYYFDDHFEDGRYDDRYYM
jgi:hypothetical protein